MDNGHSSLREFGNCRLDLKKKLLWSDGRPVQLPLKAVELLCVLVEGRGQVLTKEEIWQSVWNDTFVEETNLGHNVYLLRKALNKLGQAGAIETVPRRGYRFTGEVYEIPDDELVVQRHELTTTTIEVERESERISQRRPAFILLAIGFVVLSVAGAIWIYRATASRPSSSIRSLAVLPFREIEPSSAHRGLGIADALITRLSNVKSLIVRPTSAIASFENSDVDSLELGKNLQVDGVLEGTLYRTEKSVRVTMRLLQVADGRTIWTGEFDKPASDELSVEKEICLRAVSALSLNLNESERTALDKSYTANADAYELYQKGRYEWNKRSWRGMVDAEQLFRSAIEKDPDFALAYVGLADRLATTTLPDEAMISVAKALSLDPSLGEAHASLGFIKMFHEWNWKEAEIEFKKAIELNPGYATAHHWYAILLQVQGRRAEAESEFQKALEINPLSYNILADFGQAYISSREYDKAKEYCDKALEIYPDFVFAHEYLSIIDVQVGDYNGAIEEKLKSQRSASLNSLIDKEREESERNFVADLEKYKALGYRKFVTDRGQPDPKAPYTYYAAARMHAFLGETSEALDALEIAYSTHATFVMPFVNVDPAFDPLRNEPRFRELVKKMNLPAS